MLKKYFLPVGMIVAVALSFICPEIGTFIKKSGSGTPLVIIIFLVCGWQMKIDDFHFDRKFSIVFASGALASLFGAPGLAFVMAYVMGLGVLPSAGLVVASAVPPTLSSGIVLTGNAKGNVLLSAILTIGYNLIGVFTLPIVISWFLSGASGFDTNPLRMFCKLALQVVLPFFIGFGFKKLTKLSVPKIVDYAPSLCVILLILSFFSASNKLLREYPASTFVYVGICCLTMHIILLAAMWYGGRALRFAKSDCKALIFTGASKTLTLALATLAILGADDGAAVVPCLIFYFIQMLIDSFLAAKISEVK